MMPTLTSRTARSTLRGEVAAAELQLQAVARQEVDGIVHGDAQGDAEHQHGAGLDGDVEEAHEPAVTIRGITLGMSATTRMRTS
jgi:hypothetical protein